jgi:hypothetical protein
MSALLDPHDPGQTSGRDWYPLIFAELARIGATEAEIGVREVDAPEGESGIWIEFFSSVCADWICALDDAPMFLDSMSAGEGCDPLEFGSSFDSYFRGDDDDDDDDAAEETS